MPAQTVSFAPHYTGFNPDAAIAAGHLVITTERDRPLMICDRIKGVPQYYDGNVLLDGVPMRDVRRCVIEVHALQWVNGIVTRWGAYAAVCDGRADMAGGGRIYSRTVWSEEHEGAPTDAERAEAVSRSRAQLSMDSLEAAIAEMERLAAERSFIYRDVQVVYTRDQFGAWQYGFVPPPRGPGGAYEFRISADHAKAEIDHWYAIATCKYQRLADAIAAGAAVGDHVVVGWEHRPQIATIALVQARLMVLCDDGGLSLYCDGQPTGHIAGAQSGITPAELVEHALARERAFAAANQQSIYDAALEGHEPLII